MPRGPAAAAARVRQGDIIIIVTIQGAVAAAAVGCAIPVTRVSDMMGGAVNLIL